MFAFAERPRSRGRFAVVNSAHKRPGAVRRMLGVALAVLLAGLPRAVAREAAPSASGDEVRFRKIVLDRTFRSEGVATADVNRDGRLDIVTSNKKGVHVFLQELPRRRR